MAEAVFNMLAQNSELQDSRICARSAGIDGDWGGLETAGEAQLVMLGMGLNIRKRRTQYYCQSAKWDTTGCEFVSL